MKTSITNKNVQITIEIKFSPKQDNMGIFMPLSKT